MLNLVDSKKNVIMTCPIDLYTLADILEMMENYYFGDNTVLHTDDEIRTAFLNLKNIVDEKFSNTLAPDSSTDLAKAVVIGFAE